MSLNTDPQYFLDAIADILDNNGGIKNTDYSKSFLSVIQKSVHLVPKCVYLNVLRSTCEDIRQKILLLGAWNILFDWLLESESKRYWAFLKELLETFIHLPLTIELLKANSIPKVVRRLSKRLDIDSEVRYLASDIVTIWKDIIFEEKRSLLISQESIDLKQPSNFGKIDLVSQRLKKVTGRGSGSIIFSSTYFIMQNSFLSVDPNIDLEEDNDSAGSGCESDVILVGSSNNKSRSPGNLFEKMRTSTKRHEKISWNDKISLPSGKAATVASIETSSTSSSSTTDKDRAETSDKKQLEDLSQKRDTIKTFPSKVKSTGMKSEMDPPLKKFKIPKTGTTSFSAMNQKAGVPFGDALSYDVMSNVSSTPKVDLPDKNRTKQASTTALPHLQSTVVKSTSKDKSSSGTCNGPTAAFPGRVTTQTTRNDTAQAAATKSPTTPSINQSHKLSVATSSPCVAPAGTLPSSSQVAPVHSSPPVCTPSVSMPLKPKHLPPRTTQLIESGSFMAALESSSGNKAGLIRKKKIIAKPTADSKCITSRSPNTSASGSVYRDTLRTQLSNKTSTEVSEIDDMSKKRVKWAKEHELVQIQYFEVDESERVNVNKIRGDYKHFEMHREKEMLEAARKNKLGLNGEENLMAWRLRPFETSIVLIERGSRSSERKIQAERQSSILSEVYLPGIPIPETPKEPDVSERSVSQEPSIIPLDEPGPSAAQLPPELNKLLEGLRQSGMIGGGAGGGSNSVIPPGLPSPMPTLTNNLPSTGHMMPPDVTMMPPQHPIQSNMSYPGGVQPYIGAPPLPQLGSANAAMQYGQQPILFQQAPPRQPMPYYPMAPTTAVGVSGPATVHSYGSTDAPLSSCIDQQQQQMTGTTRPPYGAGQSNMPMQPRFSGNRFGKGAGYDNYGTGRGRYDGYRFRGGDRNRGGFYRGGRNHYSNPICREFQQYGECSYGDYCRFRHHGPTADNSNGDYPRYDDSRRGSSPVRRSERSRSGSRSRSHSRSRSRTPPLSRSRKRERSTSYDQIDHRSDEKRESKRASDDRRKNIDDRVVNEVVKEPSIKAAFSPKTDNGNHETL